MSFEYNLISAMKAHGLYINSINMETGKYHRFRSLGTCKTKCCEYRVFTNEMGAHFKCFRRGIDKIWFSDAKALTPSDRLLLDVERECAERARLCAQAKLSAKCQDFYDRIPTGTPIKHPYVCRKGIYPHGAKLMRGMLLLPVRNLDFDVISIQFIKPNGFKQFKAGAPVSGGMIWLGGHLERSYSGILRICEGWSTGCTIHSITKSPVVCALNAYNLVKVAQLFKDYYPAAHVKICADNDCWGKDNVGLKCALQASNATGYAVHYPTFDGLDVSGKPTDFNDLYALTGSAIVKNQLIRLFAKDVR